MAKHQYTKLLAIDDDVQSLGLIKEVLAETGLEILTASEADAGLRMFKEFRPQIVLLDLVMPGVQGLELLESLLEADPGADIILTGVVDFRVENKSGYRAEEYISPIDQRRYYRQVLIESTGFTFDVTVLAMDGRTGARLFQENFRDTKEKNQRATDQLAGLFENLFSLENQLLGLFVVREREANRYVFD